MDSALRNRVRPHLPCSLVSHSSRFVRWIGLPHACYRQTIVRSISERAVVARKRRTSGCASKGYVVVARNYRSPRRRGEIDLVGWDGDVPCFIEVKTRTSHDVKHAEAAVDHEKRKELRGVAREYLRRMRSDPVHRFDVVSIYLEKASGTGPIELFKNAFPVT